MTTSTPRADTPDARLAPHAAARAATARGRAFTLTEVIVAAALSGFVLAGVLSTFLVLGRVGMGSSAYVELNSRLRMAAERFNQDVRTARELRWHDERRVTLLMPAGAGPAVTYAFEPASSSSAPGRFVRQEDGRAPEVLLREVAPDFAFARFRLPVASTEPPPAANDRETALVELRLRAVRPGATSPAASQLGLTTRCVLRNKQTLP